MLVGKAVEQFIGIAVWLAGIEHEYLVGVGLVVFLVSVEECGQSQIRIYVAESGYKDVRGFVLGFRLFVRHNPVVDILNERIALGLLGQGTGDALGAFRILGLFFDKIFQIRGIFLAEWPVVKVIAKFLENVNM